MVAAASTSWPVTSPMTTATVAVPTGTTSYQSPPTCACSALGA